MVTSRRLLLKGLVSGVAGLGMVQLGPVLAAPKPQLIAGCQRDPLGKYWLVIMFEDGGVLHQSALPGRGHAPVFDRAGKRCLMVARRPGNWIKVVDLDQPDNLFTISCPSNRRFCGHAVFSADEQLIFTTENDFKRGAGVVGIYDLNRSAERLGEFETFGMGPHELLLMPDRKSLVIANGGILTHPTQGREKLNLDTMAPSLVVVQISDGKLLEQHKLPENLHQLGIRHIDVSSDASIVAGMQFEGPETMRPALLAVRKPGESLKLLHAPEQVASTTRNYIGSVKFDASGQWVAASCPRGGHVQFFDIQKGEYAGKLQVLDGCGLARGETAGEFFISNGLGELLKLQQGVTKSSATKSYPELLSMQAGYGWDNHLAAHGFRPV